MKHLSARLGLALLLMHAVVPDAGAADPPSADPYGSLKANLSEATLYFAKGFYELAPGLGEQMSADALRKKDETNRRMIETAKKWREHWKWDRDFVRTVSQQDIERDREKRVELNAETAKKTPTSILSGVALNDLLDQLLRQELSEGASLPVEPDVLKHIHVNVLGGQVGLLQAEKIKWPLLLQEELFAGDRSELEELLARARADARKGEAKIDTVKPLDEAVDRLEGRLHALLERRGAKDHWVSRQYLPAKRFVVELRANVAILREPAHAEFLLNNRLKGDNVAALAMYMRSNAVRFAPAATDGSGHRAYLRLHDAMYQEVQRLHKEREEERSKNP